MINKIEKIYSILDNQHNGYRMTLNNGKVWDVPLTEDNSDYQAIQEWINEGGTPVTSR
jgi:hypothetical protein